MNKDIKRVQTALEQYSVPQANPVDVIDTIKAGKCMLTGKAFHHLSFAHRFLTQLRYISPVLWFTQITLVALCIIVFGDCSDTDSTYIRLSVISACVALITLIGFPELCKSFSHNMWELEQSCKYNLRQLVAIKMLIIGFADLLMISGLTLIVGLQSGIPMIQVALYLIVPFNVMCIISFVILCFLRDKSNIHAQTAISVFVLLLLFFIFNKLSVFRADMVAFWATVCMLSILVLAFQVLWFMRNLRRGGDYICN